MRKLILRRIKDNKKDIFVKDEFKEFNNSDLLNVCLNLEKQVKHNLIGLYFNKSSEYVLSLMAVTLSTNAFIPLDMKQPLERLNYFVNDSKVDYVLTSKKNKEEVVNLNIKNIIYIEDLLTINKSDYTVEDKKEQYRIYTSGSTGKPKGVIIDSEYGVYNVISQQIDALNLDKEKMFLFLSISFDASLSDIYCAYLSNSIICINDVVLLKPKKLLKYFNDNKITYSDLPPSILKLFNPSDFKSFNKMIIGGELPNQEVISKYIEFNFKILNVYGPTEFSICSSMVLCDKLWTSKNIGKPLDNVEYKIVDNELLIAGVGICKGYTNDVLNNERFVFIDNKRYYKTGDLVYGFESNYYFKGRKDRQIKHNGQLICLEEIEEVSRQIKEVLNSSVIYKDRKIILFYEGDISSEDIYVELKKTLPLYMIPHYVKKEIIPKTVNGKNDNKKLLTLLEL